MLKLLREDPDNANVATPEGHATDDLDELIVDIAILIAEELDLSHRWRPPPARGGLRALRARPPRPWPLGSDTKPGTHSLVRRLTWGEPDPAK